MFSGGIQRDQLHEMVLALINFFIEKRFSAFLTPFICVLCYLFNLSILKLEVCFVLLVQLEHLEARGMFCVTCST